jgi:phosphoglycolate phosphatase-like HAD superfamily hydrolase
MFNTTKKVIVLDFDGVVVDSNIIKKDAFYSIWGDLLNNNLVDYVLSKFEGDRYLIVREVHSRIQEGVSNKIPPCTYFQNEYSKKVEKDILDIGLIDGIENYLIKSSKTFFINSATPDQSLIYLCDKLNIRHLFVDILGSKKNKIENFFYIKKKYNVSYDDMLFVGDMLSDLKVAEKLGVDFFSVLSKGSDLPYEIKNTANKKSRIN